MSTIPLSIISADNSGGVFSSVPFTASIIAATVSASASLISSGVISIVLGSPVTKSRPRMLMEISPNHLD